MLYRFNARADFIHGAKSLADFWAISRFIFFIELFPFNAFKMSLSL